MKTKTFPMWKKVVAFCATLVFFTTAVISIVIAVVYTEEDLYDQDINTYIQQDYEDELDRIAESAVEDALYDLKSTTQTVYDNYYYSQYGIVSLKVIDDGFVRSSFKNNKLSGRDTFTKTKDVKVNKKEGYVFFDGRVDDSVDAKNVETWQVKMELIKSLPIDSEVFLNQQFLRIVKNIGYFSILIFFVSAALFFWSLIYLFSVVGHRVKGDQPQTCWESNIPLELHMAIYGTILGTCGGLLGENLPRNNSIFTLVAIFTVIAVVAVFSLLYCVSIGVRIKTKTLFSNSYTNRLIIKIKALLALILDNKSVSIKISIGVLAIALVEGIMYLISVDYSAYGGYLFFFIVEKAALIVAAVKLLAPVQKLVEAGQELASGNLNYKLDTSTFKWDIKKHGDNLNSIGDGMAIAVEEGMRSERMKTELITNVSHDIKTPLTSIINYSDLIQKEKTDNKKIKEYSEVLSRQSAKLKRLIEDLVEASKASTGNLEVDLQECEANVFVGQAQGEYEEKLEAAGLTLVTKQPEEPVKIMADGRRMWRVFDNLLNNICKYSVTGTRVYLTLEKVGNEAVISFKNTSKEQLDISADELMERFVRGDKSRNTEGNGLGLNIAKSLTELQGGSLDISVDGDLFKVVLRFEAR